MLAFGGSVAAVDTLITWAPADGAPVLVPAAADADRLASLVDDLHFMTRRPRHEVLAAVVGVIVDHRAEIEARLTRRGAA